MRFGEKLRKLRKDSHLTQAELAKRAGLGLKTITNYEKGTTYPQDRRVYGVLAEILGTSADYLHNENDDFVSMAGKEFGYRGRVGAEKLVGRGDMLYAPLGEGKPKRVQGCFISSEEIERVVNFVKENGETDYDESVIDKINAAVAEKEKGGGKGGGNAASEQNAADEGDELLPAAIDVVMETGQASVSMLQRRLKLGYSRAARIVDEMETRGIVGQFEGSKPRQLLITREQWQEMSMSGRTPMEQLIEEQKDDFSAEERL